MNTIPHLLQLESPKKSSSSRAHSRDPDEVTLKVSRRDPSAYAWDDGQPCAVSSGSSFMVSLVRGKCAASNFPTSLMARMMARLKSAFLKWARISCTNFFQNSAPHFSCPPTSPPTAYL